MKYPTLENLGALELAQEFLESGRSSKKSVDARAKWLGTGVDADLDPLDDEIASLQAALEKHLEGPEAGDKDAIEGFLAGRLHYLLLECELDDEVLNDEGFWVYLSFRYFWWFLIWREKAFNPEKTPRDPAAYKRYFDAKDQTVCVLVRMYNRARISLEDGSYELANKAPKATDFWQSHILPVNTSYSPALSRAMAKRHGEDRLPTNTLRQVARSFNRTNTNVITFNYSSEEAERYVDDHWDHNL